MVLSIFKTKRITIEGTVTRADGSVESLGVVAFYDISPVNRLLFWLSQFRAFRFLRNSKRLQLG